MFNWKLDLLVWGAVYISCLLPCIWGVYEASKLVFYVEYVRDNQQYRLVGSRYFEVDWSHVQGWMWLRTPFGPSIFILQRRNHICSIEMCPRRSREAIRGSLRAGWQRLLAVYEGVQRDLLCTGYREVVRAYSRPLQGLKQIMRSLHSLKKSAVKGST